MTNNTKDSGVELRETRGAKQTVKCKRCRCEFQARVADIKRGWGKFCSKSCKAVKQEQRTGQYKAYLQKDSNYRGSGVDKETYLSYAREYGGIPNFNHKGEYQGFQCGGFDNTEHQNHGDENDQ